VDVRDLNCSAHRQPSTKQQDCGLMLPVIYTPEELLNDETD
jgi:hypothetical protein